MANEREWKSPDQVTRNTSDSIVVFDCPRRLTVDDLHAVGDGFALGAAVDTACVTVVPYASAEEADAAERMRAGEQGRAGK